MRIDDEALCIVYYIYLASARRAVKDLCSRRYRRQAPMARRGRPRTFDEAVVLDAAMLEFWRHGYEGTSISDLTRATGLNAPSIYAAFESKEKLFRSAVERYLATKGGMISRALREEPTARGAIARALLDAADVYSAAEGPRGCLLLRGALACTNDNAGLESFLDELRRVSGEMIRARIQQGLGDGELPRRVEVEPLAAFFSTVLAGMAVLGHDGAPRETLRSVARLAMAIWPANGMGDVRAPELPRPSTSPKARHRR